MKRISLAIAAAGLGATALTSTPAVGAAPHTYRDYIGTDTTQRAGIAGLNPGARLEVQPKVAPANLPQAALQAARTAKISPTPKHPLAPRRLAPGSPKAANVVTAATTSTTVCNYAPDILSANPAHRCQV